jgi:glutathione S-transferase
MKLYYSAGSCSTSCHITLEESGLKYEAVEVDFDNSSDPNIALTKKLNPLGTLPVMVLDDGKHLDQNLAIHFYIADRAKNRLLPPAGTTERAEAMNWLGFVNSDLHKGIGALFGLAAFKDSAVRQTVRAAQVENAQGYIKYLDDKLQGRDYLLGKEFTPADAYAFVVLGWTKWLEIPLTPYKNVQAYMARVAARPAVHKVLKEEGLLED